MGEPGFSVDKCDVTDSDLTMRTVKKWHPNVIFHLSAVTPYSPPDFPSQFLLNNTLGTGNVLEAATSARVKSVIFSSSFSVYGQTPDVSPVSESHSLHPNDMYSLTKMQGEELCKLYCDRGNLSAVVLRLSGVFGPRRRNGAVYTFIVNALNGTQSWLDTDLSWDIVYVKDVARACLASMNVASGFEVINIGGGCAVNIRALVEQIYRETGVEPRYQLRNAERPPSLFLDIRKAKEMLNYEPTQLSDAIAEYVAWSRTHNS